MVQSQGQFGPPRPAEGCPLSWLCRPAVEPRSIMFNLQARVLVQLLD